MQEPYEHALTKANGPNSRRALDFSYLMHGLVEAAKDPAFTAADWAPLGELIATDRFERIGNFKERVDWSQYPDLLTMWGKGTVWNFTVRRVTEGADYAILELEESAVYPDRRQDYNSVSIYEFDTDGKVRHLDVYLQIAPAAGERAGTDTWDLEKVDAEIS